MNKGRTAAAQPGHAKAPEGADNNTRLAFLEEQDERLASYLTAKHGQDFDKEGRATPADTAIALIDQFAEGVSAAHGQAEKDHARIAELGEQIRPLADYLLANHPEAIGDAGACETAVNVLAELELKRAASDAKVEALITRVEEFERAAPDMIMDLGPLRDAIADYGIELAEDLDPVQQAIAIIGRAREIMLGLAEAVVEGEHDILDGEDQFAAACRILKAAGAGDASAGEIAAIKRAEDAEAGLKAATAKVATLEGAIAELGDAEKRPGFLKRLFRSGAAAEGDEEGADEAASAREPVECGPTFGRASAAEIRDLIVDQRGDLELVFSDGAREIVEIRPYPIAPSDLVRHGASFMVNKPILVAGPEGGDLEAVGVALLAGGEQVDFCLLDRPTVIAAGQQYQFSQSFLFGS